MAQKFQAFTARQTMLAHSFEAYRYRDAYLNEVALHHHDFYEVYLFLRGNVSYSVESRTYHLAPGDILLISPLELHQPRLAQQTEDYERIVLWINRAYLEQLSSTQTSLTRCFDVSVQGHSNLLRLAPAQREPVADLMEKLVSAGTEEAYGSDLLAASYLVQLMVQLNLLAMEAPPHKSPAEASGAVARVLQYINDHYHEDLSLDLLATKFFISKYHLSHEFGRLVGTSVYRYIIQKRLVIAKQMLSSGLAPTEVYSHCGFGDYANFYRAFKAEYHISPKEFTTNARQTQGLGT